jgi:hypothetical protein
MTEGIKEGRKEEGTKDSNSSREGRKEGWKM